MSESESESESELSMHLVLFVYRKTGFQKMMIINSLFFYIEISLRYLLSLCESLHDPYINYVNIIVHTLYFIL